MLTKVSVMITFLTPTKGCQKLPAELWHDEGLKLGNLAVKGIVKGAAVRNLVLASVEEVC